jgi:L-2,4-diaminobutyrate decarboxylase
MTENLKSAYDPKAFRAQGHELIDLIADHLENSSQQKTSVNEWHEPNDQLAYWQNYQFDTNSPTPFFKDVLQKSIHVHHPKYIGHQVVPTAPVSALAHLLSGVLNNGMAVYEMGSAATAIEKIVVDLLLEKVGFDEKGDGVLTSGGTLANLTALLSARQNMSEKDVWVEGSEEQLGIKVSSEAHYCVDRAVRIMGLGAQGVVKVPVDEQFKMRTELLEECYEKAIAAGIKIIAVVGSAPSTSTGIYDDLEAIAAFCKEKGLWFHVDASHGGAVVFSEKYKSLMSGAEVADSIVIDGHKMLMTPGIMTFLLYKKKSASYATFSQKAQYLWSASEDEDWYNLAKRTFECTKEMMSIKFFVLWKMYGEVVFSDFVNQLYDMAKAFANMIEARSNFEIAVSPDSNIVCFRKVKSGLSLTELNELNTAIRTRILEKGDFYIVQTNLDGVVWLRVTIMTVFTGQRELEELLESC